MRLRLDGRILRPACSLELAQLINYGIVFFSYHKVISVGLSAAEILNRTA